MDTNESFDTNEFYEHFNLVTKLRIVDLTPYPRSFVNVFSERGRLLECSPSLWKETIIQPKKKKLKTLSGSSESESRIEQLEQDTLLGVLSLLDIRSLIRCMCVDWRLNRTIQSVELRRLWSHKQSPVVLLSSRTLPCKLWVPGSSSSAAEVFPPLTGATLHSALVVASHRGLVCVRFMNSYFDSSGLDLVVGNPLTREWVALPKSKGFGYMGNYRYRMQVANKPGIGGEAGYRVHFKVAGFTATADSYCYHVFQSATGKWSTTSLNFPWQSASTWSAFDLRSGTWRTELIRNWSIKTGLERSRGEVHRLPLPTLHGFDEWEYRGSTYFASVWTVKQQRYDAGRDAGGELAGYGVWRVQRGTAAGGAERLETVAAVWARELGMSSEAVTGNLLGGTETYVADCNASGNLVCFGGESEQSPTMPIVVYDIETGQWSMLDEQHPAADSEVGSSGDHYAAAVAYTPSLLVAPRNWRLTLNRCTF